MGRKPCCDKVGLKKGPWTAEEDKKLINFILTNGQCCWRALPKLAGLPRCGKSCRLRWTNYLRPDLKRGVLSEYEEKTVIDLHAQLGNRWSKIASHLPGRTDNEIKNHWNTHIRKKLKKMGIDPLTHQPLPPPPAASPDHDNGHTDGQSKEPDDKDKDSAVSADVKEPEHAVPSFCVDEVPLIDPNEILIPRHPSSSSSASSSSMSTPSNSAVIGHGNIFKDLEFPELEWPWDYSDNIRLWDDEFDWHPNLLIEEGAQGRMSTGPTDTPSAVNYSYQVPVLDQISWTS
ncbi:hypothetical protein MLD38_013351 [Melastoma candidum]|uniref:Uncharacterized protein n=1 Tax=Melastoma candidum TaxID=119954 RepID=A0ACB9RHR5_9MYRT|nr:hypothetical protein MLD38_013351 [Melastoma candidum]